MRTQQNISYVWTTSSFISQKTMTISGRSVTNYGSLNLTDISILTGLNDTLGMARTIVHILTSSLSKYHVLTLDGYRFTIGFLYTVIPQLLYSYFTAFRVSVFPCLFLNSFCLWGGF